MPSPIGHHGVVGDLETIALVGHEGRIEWLCWPRFDSPSLFGCLLDDDGGHWTLGPEGEDVDARQLYLPDTNVLLTRFHHDDGLVEVEDFMVVGSDCRGLVRRVLAVRGHMRLESEIVFRPDYGRSPAELTSTEEGVRLSLEGEDLLLTASVPLRLEGDRILAGFDIAEGDTVTFRLAPASGPGTALDDLHFDTTVRFWREWIGKSTYRGRWRQIVHRSALVLKLLTHAPTGGVLAAGTTSLPEVLGGERNWDYRYVWIRDAAFTLYAFMELGFTEEARGFTRWLEARVDRCWGGETSPETSPLSPFYDLDGNVDLAAAVLDHWSGYQDSRPVTIGNGAIGQLQLDIYGELIDSLYLADKHGDGLSLDVWNKIRFLIDWVCDHWNQPDEGIWEVRSGRHEFVFSRLMCWVAVERGIRMANFRGRPADLMRWRTTRDEIHGVILDRGWSEKLGAFTQTLDGDTLDASLLLMPMVKFISPVDPKWLSTLDAIGEHLSHDALVDRYDSQVSDDGLDGQEGSFSMCSFWYIENLARSGRIDEARLLFEKILTYASPLGLFAEQIATTGRQLGNFPQAFTHLAMISTALALDKALDG